jgi:D-alanyl-D-alanine carboxypeptidase
MKNINKKTLILVSLAFVLILSLSMLFIYQYKNSNRYTILNEAKKSEEGVEDENNVDDSTEDISESIDEETPEQINTQENGSSASSVNWWEYPEEIYEAERDGDDLLVLVNKKYKLPSSYTPSDLVKASESGIRRGENYYLREILIADLTNLVNDAESAGIDLSIVSGYRSYSTQESTYQHWVNYNGGDTDEADKISARAGHSQHQLGTTVDFSTSEISDGIGSQFNGTAAQEWLETNAYKYGFVLAYPYGREEITGYSYESWHYRYIGIENAKGVYENGMILEIYLEGKN